MALSPAVTHPGIWNVYDHVKREAAWISGHNLGHADHPRVLESENVDHD